MGRVFTGEGAISNLLHYLLMLLMLCFRVICFTLINDWSRNLRKESWQFEGLSGSNFYTVQ